MPTYASPATKWTEQLHVLIFFESTWLATMTIKRAYDTSL